MQTFGILCLFLAVFEISCSDLAGKEDIYHWGAERDVGHRVLRAWQKMHSFFLQKLTRKVEQAR